MEPTAETSSNNAPLDIMIPESKKKKLISKSYLIFLGKKVAFYALVFMIAVTLAFLIPRLLPNDPLAQLLVPPTQATPEIVAQYLARKVELEKYFHLDKSLWEQYWIFLRDLFRGDLGPSIETGFPAVSRRVIPRLLLTLVIVIPIAIITFWLGNSVGALIGYKRNTKNNILYYFFVAIQTIPFFWVAYCFLLLFVVKWQLLDILPPTSFANTPWNIIKVYFLCFTVLLLGFTGGWATGMRSMMIYETESDYILYCRKLGFTDRKLRQYAKRNSMLPQFTGLNLRFNDLVGSTFVLEFVFAWNGLGWLVVEAYQRSNYPLIIGAFIVSIIIVVAGNFIIDIIYGFIDPRIRVGGKK